MPTRTITAEGKTWRVFPSGRVTQNDRDEFALIFVSGGGSGSDRQVRVTRYSPVGARSRERSLVEMSDAAQGTAAINALNNTDVDGRKLTVNEAKPKPAGGGGGGRGGFGGGRGGGGGGGGGRGGW